MEGIGYPEVSELKIDFCGDKKKFYLSAPIFSSACRSVRAYVHARKDRVFQPHATSFHIHNNVVHLTQEIPFHWGPVRQQILQFYRYCKKCQKMLSEIAIEQIQQEATLE
ncbi:MAG: hypothetical protein HY069_04785 [Chlamydiia bacterium]|nr:hypothetical protein [Chlamydiia bacterium]